MKTSLFLALSLMLMIAPFAHAQDAASLRAAIETHYSAIHAGNIDAVWSHHLPDFSMFWKDGSVLFEPGFGEAAERMGATPEFPEINVTMRDFNAQIYDDIGVATFYLYGSDAWRGDVTDGTWRVSAVWRWQDGEWKEAHHHESPLMGRRHH
jgi:ketosteroid isomerase-like protein